MRNPWFCCSLKTGMAAVLCAASLTLAQTGMAQAVQKVRVDIPAQDLSAALTQFGRETGTEIVFAPDAVREKKAGAVKGEYERGQVLKMLLEGSGLTYRVTAQGAIVVEPSQTRASVGQVADLRLAHGETQQAMQKVQGEAATENQNNTEESSSGDFSARAQQEEIVVTGSRISRSGFQQPTPVTVIGESELRAGARANVAQVLNDQPQFRPSTTPAVSVANTSSGTAPVDLRGLGDGRTLTLLNGRRFSGGNNLNLIPSGLIDSVEVVTGGASAAYGSDAVAGVVNVLLKKDLEGLSLNASTGVSTRGDAEQHMFGAAYGTSFADANGHFMVGAEYVKDQGIRDRNSRRNLGSAGFLPIGNGQFRLFRDVNYLWKNGNGVILGGPLAGQMFTDAGLRAFQGPTPVDGSAPLTIGRNGVGGADAENLYDHIYGSTPFERANVYARASYEIGNAELWIEGLYGRSKSAYPALPDVVLEAVPQTVRSDNPFLTAHLTPAQQQALADAGPEVSIGRVFFDIFPMTFDLVREDKEAAIGIDGKIGGSGWSYSGFFTHGEQTSDQSILNSRITANYAKAVDAVRSGGQIICRVNDPSDGNPANDDPACVPIDIFGYGRASQAALDYVRGTQQRSSKTTLDVVGAELQGDLFSLWAGPLTIAVGAEARWEELSQGPEGLSKDSSIFGLPVFGSTLSGKTDVKEGFLEAAIPVLHADRFQVDLNGAARYSDYSLSGGIWSWKAGATTRAFDQLLLRATRSRDIRAPSIGELFASRLTVVGPVVDQDDPAGRFAADPAYVANPSTVTTFIGGNPELDPEISYTSTIGFTFSPAFIPNFNFSVDYYNIEIGGAITSLNGSSLTLACNMGNSSACDRVVRDAHGTVTTVFANAQNIAEFSLSGVDIEAAYTLPLSPGSLRMRLLATRTKTFIFNTGVTNQDFVGDVGDALTQGLPEWRGVLSANWDTGRGFNFGARVRYVDGGVFSHALQGILVNNKISSRTYVDLDAQYQFNNGLTLFANANNVFDKEPPLSTTGPNHYDVIGAYMVLGARMAF